MPAPIPQRARGIVLRTRPLTETSLIVQWLTPEFGRLDTVAKGARRPQSPFRGKLDLFYEAEFSFQRSRRSDLHTLREVSLLETHPPLRRELAALRQAAYAATLLEQTTEKGTPLPGIFELLRDLLRVLSHHPPQPRNIFALELKLLNELGLGPDPDQTRLSAETRKLVIALTESGWPEIISLQATAAQARELREFLHGFLIFHLGKIPAGRAGLLV
jgi:DNA repair protein RecO (recombination protein O)